MMISNTLLLLGIMPTKYMPVVASSNPGQVIVIVAKKALFQEEKLSAMCKDWVSTGYYTSGTQGIWQLL